MSGGIARSGQAEQRSHQYPKGQSSPAKALQVFLVRSQVAITRSKLTQTNDLAAALSNPAKGQQLQAFTDRPRRTPPQPAHELPERFLGLFVKPCLDG